MKEDSSEYTGLLVSLYYHSCYHFRIDFHLHQMAQNRKGGLGNHLHTRRDIQYIYWDLKSTRIYRLWSTCGWSLSKIHLRRIQLLHVIDRFLDCSRPDSGGDFPVHEKNALFTGDIRRDHLSCCHFSARCRFSVSVYSVNGDQLGFALYKV